MSGALQNTHRFLFVAECNTSYVHLRQIVYHSDEQRKRFGCRLQLVEAAAIGRVAEHQLVDEVKRRDERAERRDERLAKRWFWMQMVEIKISVFCAFL